MANLRKLARIIIAGAILGTLGLLPFAQGSSAGEPTPLDIRSFSASLSPGGDPWAVWSVDNGFDTEVFYSRWTSRGWSQARAVYQDSATWDEFPSLTFAADGTPWVAWSSSTRDEGALYVSRWVGYRWSRPQQIPVDPASQPRQPALAAAPDGSFWLAWIGFDGNDDEIYVSHWDGLAWSSPQQVGQDDTDPLAYDTHPRLAVDADGLPWLVWVSSEGLYDDVVVASRWEGKSWSAEQIVSLPDNSPDVWPSLALDDSGQPWVAWQDVAGSGADARWRIYVSRWQAESASWSKEALASSPIELPLDEDRPNLKFDANGQPHLAWAVLGQVSGVAHASWDGTAWRHAAWTAAQDEVEAPILLPAENAWLLWTDLKAGPVPLVERRLADIEEPLPDNLPQSTIVPQADAIRNRYTAWGDSITLGAYDDPKDSGDPVIPYPTVLENKLDARVVESEVINRGVNGEKARGLRERIGSEAAIDLPQFALIMIGTNDVTAGNSPSQVVEHLSIMLDILKKHLKIKGLRPWFATIPPRGDHLNNATETMSDYIRDYAAYKNVPCADIWQAFTDRADWASLLRDHVHPGREGLQLIADTFYRRVLEEYSWLEENPDDEPPVTWIDGLPAKSECGDIVVQWTGTDNMSQIADYDVQAQENYGLWTDWFMATTAISGTYPAEIYGDVLGFRVRGRDHADNQSDYSAAAYTIVDDFTPPYDVYVGALPPAQTLPIDVVWSGKDDCSGVNEFDVQYCVGSLANCTAWKTTSDSSASFTTGSPQYGQTYYFRALARDKAGRQTAWSEAVSTTLARYALDGQVRTVRDEPVVGATVAVTDALAVSLPPGGSFAAYVADGGAYDLDARRDGFGVQPPMRAVSVTGDISDLSFVLPPVDDVVSDGDFEAGAWGQWQVGGTAPPTLTVKAHTGSGAVLMAARGKRATLSQKLDVPASLTDATLSFMARLDDETGGNSVLQVELGGTPLSYTQVISSEQWAHVWFPVDAAVGESVTLTLTMSDTPAVRLDEVYLGPALFGGSLGYLPVVFK